MNLIEILVSIVVFLSIVLGADAMHIVAIRESTEALNKSVAMQEIMNLAERLSVVTRYDAGVAALSLWQQEVREVLPEGESIIVGNWPSFQVSVCWRHQYCVRETVSHEII